MKKYYKVVDKTRDYYFSCSAITPREGYSLNYRVGKETKPKYGYIYAFRSLHYARHYARLFAEVYPFSILVGSGEFVDEKPRITHPNTISIKAFWDDQEVDSIKAAPGTVWLKSFTPEKVVE